LERGAAASYGDMAPWFSEREVGLGAREGGEREDATHGCLFCSRVLSAVSWRCSVAALLQLSLCEVLLSAWL